MLYIKEYYIGKDYGGSEPSTLFSINLTEVSEITMPSSDRIEVKGTKNSTDHTITLLFEPCGGLAYDTYKKSSSTNSTTSLVTCVPLESPVRVLGVTQDSEYVVDKITSTLTNIENGGDDSYVYVVLDTPSIQFKYNNDTRKKASHELKLLTRNKLLVSDVDITIPQWSSIGTYIQNPLQSSKKTLFINDENVTVHTYKVAEGHTITDATISQGAQGAQGSDNLRFKWWSGASVSPDGTLSTVVSEDGQSVKLIYNCHVGYIGTPSSSEDVAFQISIQLDNVSRTFHDYVLLKGF